MRYLLACILFAAPVAAYAGPRIDLNQDNGRADVLAPGWVSWRVQETKAVSLRFDGITAELRAPGGKLITGWWKPGFDYPARMASDGVTVAGKLELVLSGLAAGKHTLGTYHSTIAAAKPSRITVEVQGASVAVTPSNCVKHDSDAASAYLEFTAEKGKDVVVVFTPDADGSVILNGFELDRSDPAKRAARPIPFDHDEHSPETPTLSWRASSGATAYLVYLGTNAEKVASATRESPDFRGETRTESLSTADLQIDHRRPYFWRVDTVHASGIVRGEVWQFCVRHLAFPEAEGYGRFAIGGRAGKLYAVTSLEDAGPGTLREAVEATGPRTVVFRVGGTINLKSKLIVRNPYLTVAGQTAPGDGICLKNYTFGCSDTHDVIIRHVRIRVGDESGLTQDGSGARGSDHVIYDHCSISWSIDEGFSSREGGNLTVQRCIISEALNIANHKKYTEGKGHSFAASISGNVGSFHHNLLANWYRERGRRPPTASLEDAMTVPAETPGTTCCRIASCTVGSNGFPSVSIVLQPCASSSFSICLRAAVPTSRNRAPPLPITMPFWLGRSTYSSAWTSRSSPSSPMPCASSRSRWRAAWRCCRWCCARASSSWRWKTRRAAMRWTRSSSSRS